MPKKILLDLKDTRVNRMMEEQRALQKEREMQEKSALQNQILMK